MQQMSVIERPVAAAEPGCSGNRPLHVISGAIDGLLEAETLG
jgi:hypothetical protein